MWNNTAPPLETGFVRLPSGVRLHYRRMGDDGSVVLLLHGWPETGHAWRRVIPTLAMSGYTAVAPDLRGSGDSDKPSGGYDAVTRMEDVRSLIQALELAEVPLFVVGHSDDGGRVAQAYAIEHPSEVDGLALISPAPRSWGRGAGEHEWHYGLHQTADLPEVLIAPQIETYLRHFFRTWSHDPHMLPEADLAVYVQHLSTPGALRASFGPVRAVAGDYDDAVRDFRKPLEQAVRLILGDSDPRLVATLLQAEWKHAARDVSIEKIVRGGHWLPEERPDAVAAALLTFFEGLRAVH